jgi:WD40 repeat protein
MLRKLTGHTGWVNAVAVTRDGRHALSGATDRTLRVWDLESAKRFAFSRVIQAGSTPWR